MQEDRKMSGTRISGLWGWIILVVIVVLVGSVTASGKVIYVDDNASLGGNGQNWATPYRYLQDALGAASSGDEIQVAEGMYRPDQDSAHPSGTGNREATFQLKNGVAIKGGYAGFGQPEPDARDPNIYETILSGDLAGNDVRLENPSDLLDHLTRTENSYHVVNSIYNDETAVLDGFTISSGNSNHYNVSHYHIGGGIYNRFGNCTVSNCMLIYNSAYNGGGAMRMYENSSVLTNCKFISNYTQLYGGAISNKYSNISLVNCEFIDNSTGGNGGAIWNSRSTNTLLNCSFVDNSAATYGGGMYNTRSQIDLINCKFTQNFGGHYGGGMYNYRTDLTILNCVFERNRTGDRGGAMYTYGGNQQLGNCAFVDNYASSWGAARFTRHCAETLTNCLFVGNWADKIGAAVYSFNNTSQFTNCTFADNIAPNGSSLACEHVFVGPSDINITNCIFWDDGDEIWNNDNSIITITYSDVQGGWPGEGNIDADPCFVEPGYWDPNGAWIEGDYLLLPGSPCIDAGDNSAIPPSVITDLDGYPRIRGPAVDMGAYERPLVLFVDADAVGANNGSSWSDAYNYLQYALAVAQSRDEIRVAQGIYKPTKGSVRSISFELLNGVAIYGGFPPGGGTWFERNPSTYETILSGDLFGNDGPNFTNNGDNSYHVVTGSSCDETAVLDGFTITAGNANGSNPHYYGGGIYIGKGSSPTIINCAFTQNSAHWAGGLYIGEDSSSMIINCTFIQNSAKWGGAIWNYFGSPTLINCMFIGNSTDFGSGGAIYDYTHDQMTITNCLFIGNSAGSRSGGIESSYGTLNMTNCILWGNTDARGMGESAQISRDYGKLPGIINYCCIQGWTGNLGGIGNMGDDPLFVDVTIDNYHLLPDSSCIDAGDPDYIAEPDETDLDGNPRVFGGRIDMGAYEYFNTRPVADAGPDRTVEAQAHWGATVTLDGSGSSDVDSTPGTSDDINDFNWFEIDPCDPNADVLLGSGRILDCNLSIGEHIILLDVIDKAGASDTNEVTIIVQDTTPPDIICPPDVTLECPANTTPSATGKATATDTCGAATITHSDQWQQSCGNAGILARTWTATDESGNTSTCVQFITVVDTTPPVITCPPDVTLQCPADTSVEANGSASAVDTCGTVTIAHSDQWQPGCGNTGTLTRTWSATDECGNSSSSLQTLTVVDTTTPQFQLSVAPTMLWPPDHKMVLITPTWTVSDECDAAPQVSLVSIVANEGDDTIGDGHTSNDIQINADGSIYLRSERSGTSDDRVYTITYQAVDDCGNTTVRSATVSIPHDFKVLARIAARWLWAGPGSIPEDLNGDGVVNLKDIAIFANNWIQ